MQDVLIIGTGMAATALASTLAGKARVTLVEKSRGFGGRMATRRREGFEFDHGAQFSLRARQSLSSFSPSQLNATRYRSGSHDSQHLKLAASPTSASGSNLISSQHQA